jgi:hypothetical protein
MDCYPLIFIGGIVVDVVLLLLVLPALFVKDPPEVCVCSAWKTADGQLITGRRHPDCLAEMADRGLERLKQPDEDGFLTSKGRFVTRREGRMLQDAAGIPSASADGKGYRGDSLYSEDLY